MQKSEGSFFSLGQCGPVGANGLKQIKCTDNVSLDEISRAMNRAVNVRLCCEIQYCARLVLGEQGVYAGTITNISLHKGMTFVVRERGQIVQITGVSELIQIDDRLIMAFQPGVDKVTANKTGAASDENHVVSSIAFRID